MAGSWSAPPTEGGSGPLIGNGAGSSNTVDFPGGKVVMSAVATAWNASTVTINVLGPDGQTLIPTALTLAANGITAALDLPPGRIQATVTGGVPTGLYVGLARVVY